MALKALRCPIGAGPGCVLSDLHVVARYICLTMLWDMYWDYPQFTSTKTEAQGRRGDLHHHLTAKWPQIGIQTLGIWGPEFVFLVISYLREGARFSSIGLFLLVLLNETSFLRAWTKFSLRK